MVDALVEQAQKRQCLPLVRLAAADTVSAQRETGSGTAGRPDEPQGERTWLWLCLGVVLDLFVLNRGHFTNFIFLF